MSLRNKLIDTALQWQERFGVAPSITSAISEYDAALLVGMTENEYSDYMQDKTAVSKGADFIFKVHPTFRVIDNCIQNYCCPVKLKRA